MKHGTILLILPLAALLLAAPPAFARADGHGGGHDIEHRHRHGGDRIDNDHDRHGKDRDDLNQHHRLRLGHHHGNGILWHHHGDGFFGHTHQIPTEGEGIWEVEIERDGRRGEEQEGSEVELHRSEEE